MNAFKPDTRSRQSMAADKGGEWGAKPQPVKGRSARRRVASDAPMRKFATINGERVEVRQVPAKAARPYPSAPVNARPGSRVAATVLRGEVKHIPRLPYRRIGAEPAVGRRLTKAEAANHLPFMPEFQAEGQPFPRISRDKEGNVMPRVRTDNGMTRQLQGRGIGRSEDGTSTYTKRQLAAREEERKAQAETRLEVVRLRQLAADAEDARKDVKRALMDAIGREREALAQGDVEAGKAARADVRKLRKASRYTG